jgi:hypothetical protein
MNLSRSDDPRERLTELFREIYGVVDSLVEENNDCKHGNHCDAGRLKRCGLVRTRLKHYEPNSDLLTTGANSAATRAAQLGGALQHGMPSVGGGSQSTTAPVVAKSTPKQRTLACSLCVDSTLTQEEIS